MQNPTPFTRAGWLLELVFDYGDHGAVEPSPTPDVVWPGRPDAFSSYRSGFEIRTQRLCRRILMFHHFSELGDDPPPVRSTDLSYDLNPVASQLTRITHTGYEPGLDGEDGQTVSLPPLDLGYTQPEWNRTVETVSEPWIDNLPAGISPPAEWVDLNGDGVGGVLTRSDQAWRFKRNLGDGRFGPLELLPTLPSLSQRDDATQQLLDIDGSGRRALVSLDEGHCGYFERSYPGEWHRFVPFHSMPRLNWLDPNLRAADLTGDGVADLVLTEEGCVVLYESLGTDGFAPPIRIPQPPTRTEGRAFSSRTLHGQSFSLT